MGNGIFRNNKFDFVVVANFQMSSDDWAQWQRAFIKANEILFNASEGQFQFGNIYMADDSNGIEYADMILHAEGDPAYASGRFGTAGQALHLMPYVKSQVLSIVHEFGHFAWGLGDEYTAPLFNDTVDQTSPAPNNRTIPISGAAWANNELVGMNAQALLLFGDNWERRRVVSNTQTQVVVDADFPDLPTAAEHPTVWYQTPAECSDVANSSFCIMERSRSAAGTLAPDGTWTPAANPVTEFCSASNHDSDQDTQHHDSHGHSCWEEIIEQAGFTDYVAPDPASAVAPAAGHTDPTFFVLETEPRFALVLDRSFSMNEGTKMQDAQFGAIYWLEFCKESDDHLSVIWYDDVAQNMLDLTQVNSIGAADLETLKTNIRNLTPRGNTSITRGLDNALNELTSAPNRAATQVAILMTDGKHNQPVGTTVADSISDLKTNGVVVYTLGVGDPDEVEMPPLEALANETGGRAYAVGSSSPDTIQTRLMEINAEVRGGLIASIPVDLPATDPGELDRFLADQRANSKRPPLEDLLKFVGLNDKESLRHLEKLSRGRLSAVPMFVESGCDRASFAVAYPPDTEVWVYLVDPDGNPIDMTDPRIKHVTSSAAPHEFALVEAPKDGIWHMVLVRVSRGQAIQLQAIGGAENPKLQAYANVTSHQPAVASVMLRASARWENELTGLSVRAVLRSPTGKRHTLRLNDSLGEEDESGAYAGVFQPGERGRYTGQVFISSSGNNHVAKPLTRMLHFEGGSMPSASVSPPFLRSFPIQFHVGNPPKISDEEPGLKQSSCIDFEDLQTGTRFRVGDAFSTGGFKAEVKPYTFFKGQKTNRGFALVRSGNASGGTGQELGIHNVNIEFHLAKPARGLTLKYGEFGGNINLEINGDFANAADLDDLDGAKLGGVRIGIVPTSARQGQLVLVGKVEQFAIGGQELLIDNICFGTMNRKPLLDIDLKPFDIRPISSNPLISRNLGLKPLK